MMGAIIVYTVIAIVIVVVGSVAGDWIMYRRRNDQQRAALDRLEDLDEDR